ncbi:F-box protein SKIP23-like isoform X2 [Chenopodium quinoa]|uniref:F-box protein SKIP23-like isoform X2 n=1 Tax=Chenopodium quinoa TaxID=63459 RepID=UPI000B78563D|nr:F-box protein SKIP23-like isoform X2 [Chenopodium quinoa]
MTSNRRRRVSWSGLPPELLTAVADRLETRADILHFRRACKTWRASAPLSLLTPKNILSPIFPHSIDINRTKFLVANSVFLVRSAINPKLQPWLVSVEESNPGILSVRSPLSRLIAERLPEKFPQNLDLSQFHVSELARFHTYKLVDKNSTDNNNDESDDVVRYYNHPTNDFPLDNRVVLFVSPDCTKDDYTVVELSDLIRLIVIRFKNGATRHVNSWGRKLDDVICFKGKIYGVDRKGRVCSMDYKSLKMLKIVEEPLCEGSGSDNKKRLVVSCDELYLVYTVWGFKNIYPTTFKVLKLNEEEKKWDKLDQGIGNDRILFVTFDGCFFALAKDFPQWKGNCIVSRKECFPLYSNSRFFNIAMLKGVMGIVVYHFEGGDFRYLLEYPSYSEVLWPPPSWLWTDASLLTCVTDSGSEGGGDGAEDGVKLQSGSSIKITPDLIPKEEIDEISPNYVQVAEHVQHVQQHVAHEGFNNQNNVDSAPAMHSPLKIFEKDVSQSKFLGVDVSSHSVPILKKIWAKYGNITEGHVVTSDCLLSWALESLAKIIIILPSSSGSSLDDSQAKYLESTLPDLQLMQFKLDWLVPLVKNALFLHKNKDIMELQMKKSKLQTELREVEKKLAEMGKLVPECQLASASSYLKDVLC